jgi:hypothetical protein
MVFFSFFVDFVFCISDLISDCSNLLFRPGVFRVVSAAAMGSKEGRVVLPTVKGAMGREGLGGEGRIGRKQGRKGRECGGRTGGSKEVEGSWKCSTRTKTQEHISIDTRKQAIFY